MRLSVLDGPAAELGCWNGGPGGAEDRGVVGSSVLRMVTGKCGVGGMDFPKIRVLQGIAHAEKAGWCHTKRT